MTEEKLNKETSNEAQKVAVIVGASSGIGYHTAAKLLKKGYRVYNLSRTPNNYAEVINLAMDAEKTASVNAAFTTFATLEQRIDIFIYCAGYSMAAPVEHVKMKDVEKLFSVNYFGALKTVQKAIPFLKNGGRIVLVSSMASVLPIAFDSFYSSSKAALDMLAKGLSLELQPYNIKVTSAMPGGTATRFTYKRNVYSKENVKEYAERVEKSVKSLEKTEQKGMLPSEVATCIVSICLKENPPSREAIGIINKSYKLAHKILPERVVDYLNSRSLQ